MKKTLILGLVVCSLLIAPIYSVVGADQELSIEDDTNDVLDESANEISRPNIDIAEASCTREGKRVELRLKLVAGGEIQNSYSIMYYLILITSSNQYDAYYSAIERSVSDFNYNEVSGVVYSGVGTQTLTISFDLSSSDEECQSLEAYTMEIDESSEHYYADSVPDEDIEDQLVVYVGGPYEGVAGESVNFSGAVYGGYSPYTWEWDFGDGNTSDEQNSTHVYAEAGEYYVNLTVTDDYGLTEYDTTIVVISDDGDDGGDDGEDGDGSADGGSNGGSDGGSSSDLGVILFGAVIGIIVIIGIVVIVAIIRR